jgi:hypothetical protein
MDPNENIKKQLELARSIVTRIDASPAIDDDVEALRFVARMANDLVEYIHDLDHWLCGGGVRPERWRLAPKGPKATSTVHLPEQMVEKAPVGPVGVISSHTQVTGPQPVVYVQGDPRGPVQGLKVTDWYSKPVGQVLEYRLSSVRYTGSVPWRMAYVRVWMDGAEWWGRYNCDQGQAVRLRRKTP